MSATRSVKSTDYFKSMPDYQEAQRFREKYAHIGSLNLSPLKEMRDKVIKEGVNADCFGDFFCPERTGSGVMKRIKHSWLVLLMQIEHLFL